MDAGSVSKVVLNLSLKGSGILNLELKRHLAPKTVGSIIRAVPLEGNAHMLGKSVALMDTNLNTGGEKLRNSFKKGDIGFMAGNGSICFFLEDVNQSRPMTLVGKIITNLDVLTNVKPGDIFSITQAGT